MIRTLVGIKIVDHSNEVVMCDHNVAITFYIWGTATTYFLIAKAFKLMSHSHWSQRVCPTWWRHQMETFPALLAICAGNSPVPVEFPTQRPVTRSFDVFFDLRLNKRLSKQWWGRWFETLSRPLWRHRNVYNIQVQRRFAGIHLILTLTHLLP